MTLPPLAFGNNNAVFSEGSERATENFAHIVPSAQLRGTTPHVFSRMALRTIEKTSLMAYSATAGSVEVQDTQGWHLVVNIFGSAVMRGGGQEVEFGASSGGLLLPNIARKTDSVGMGSTVIATIDREQLLETGTRMSGREQGQLRLDEHIHQLPLASAELRAAFHQICRMVDISGPDGQIAVALGTQDTLYRWLALSLGWMEDADEAARRGPPPGKLDNLCDMIRQSFSVPLTMSQMEEFSGLSSRSLQYAFRERFGCSPMEWQRRERMMLAREQLIANGPETSITQLAHAMNFSSSAAFATLYKRHFNETPSQTIERAHGPASLPDFESGPSQV